MLTFRVRVWVVDFPATRTRTRGPLCGHANGSVIFPSRLVCVEDPLRVVVGVEEAVSAQQLDATVRSLGPRRVVNSRSFGRRGLYCPAVGSEATTVAVCKEKRGRVSL